MQRAGLCRRWLKYKPVNGCQTRAKRDTTYFRLVSQQSLYAVCCEGRTAGFLEGVADFRHSVANRWISHQSVDSPSDQVDGEFTAWEGGTHAKFANAMRDLRC